MERRNSKKKYGNDDCSSGIQAGLAACQLRKAEFTT